MLHDFAWVKKPMNKFFPFHWLCKKVNCSFSWQNWLSSFSIRWCPHSNVKRFFVVYYFLVFCLICGLYHLGSENVKLGFWYVVFLQVTHMLFSPNTLSCPHVLHAEMLSLSVLCIVLLLTFILEVPSGTIKNNYSWNLDYSLISQATGLNFWTHGAAEPQPNQVKQQDHDATATDIHC